MEYERQVASVRAQNALEGDFSISQAEMSSRQAMLENASDIKVTHLAIFLINDDKVLRERFYRNSLRLCSLAGEVQHICPWQGAFCQR